MADDPMVIDLECMGEQAQKKQPKVIYAGDAYEDQPVFVITEDFISLVGDPTDVIAVSQKYGITLSGRISLSCLPNQLSFGGGFWRLDPRHLSTLASTTPTPIPLLVKSKPLLFSGQEEVSDSLNWVGQKLGVL